jgi:hypothetical protein
LWIWQYLAPNEVLARMAGAELIDLSTHHLQTTREIKLANGDRCGSLVLTGVPIGSYISSHSQLPIAVTV